MNARELIEKAEKSEILEKALDILSEALLDNMQGCGAYLSGCPASGYCDPINKIHKGEPCQAIVIDWAMQGARAQK